MGSSIKFQPTVSGEPVTSDSPDYEIIQGANGSNGSGGGAACDGAHGIYDGGGGAGCVLGFTSNVNFNKSNQTSNSTTDKSLTLGDYTITHIYAMILCGGSGAGSSRSAGVTPTTSTYGAAGGGAWGSGGTLSGHQNVPPFVGPGGSTFGKGGDATDGTYANGGDGAWAVIDYSTGTFSSGTGGGDKTTTGYAKIYRVETKPGHYNVQLRFDNTVDWTIQISIDGALFGTVTVSPKNQYVWVPIDENQQISLLNTTTSESAGYTITRRHLREGINVVFS